MEMNNQNPSTSKPNRRAGAFLIVWRGILPIFYIDEQYHLYKDNAHVFNQMDAIELSEMRRNHIENSDKIEMGSYTYVVWFQCEITEQQKRELIRRYHEGETSVLQWND